ncbi:MAG: tRNA (N6-isopentenyl adenosine(37)-C2)-methylthiotransferase MiaB [bacterium]
MAEKLMTFHKNSPKFFIKTYGCQMNEYDSEILAGLLKESRYELTARPEEADLILLNTCYVREKVKHKIYSKLGELKKLKEKNPNLILGVCGCLAQKEPRETLHQAPYLDFILGTFGFSQLPRVLEKIGENHSKIIRVEEKEAVPEGLPKQRQSRFTAYVPVIRGCSNFCSYCNVPYVRGPERSRLPDDILKEVEELSWQGCKEVTLLGQNVNSYGKDLSGNQDFAELLTQINRVKGIQRIRFTTSHPKDLSDKLIDRIAHLDKVCEHLHLPLQSGSNRILSRMRRGYTREEYQNRVRDLREAVPGVSLTTDIIVGFPGESEADFQETLDAVKRIGFDGAFTFCYSRLPGTEAARLEDQVPEEIKKERLRMLIDLQQKITLEKNSRLVGGEFEVLVEGFSEKSYHQLQGRARSNKIVVFEAPKELIGNFVRVRILEAGCWALRGKTLPC